MSGIRKSTARKKREQQVKRQKLMIAAVTLVMIVMIFNGLLKKGNKEENTNEIQETSSKIENVDSKVDEKETEEEKLMRVRKEAEEAGYPEDVIELLSKNPETLEFVEQYAEKKDRPEVTEIEELEKGKIPQLLQWDERWGYSPYGTSIIAVCGCGPTCLSMVLSGLTEDNTLTPARIAEYGTKHHYINEENDTYWVFMSEAAEEWKVECEEKMLEEEELKKELEAGHPVICNVGPGDFTQIGHFIVLAGYEDGEVIVHDPFSQKNSDKRWKFEDFKDQIKAMWIYW